MVNEEIEDVSSGPDMHIVWPKSDCRTNIRQHNFILLPYCVLEACKGFVPMLSLTYVRLIVKGSMPASFLKRLRNLSPLWAILYHCTHVIRNLAWFRCPLFPSQLYHTLLHAEQILPWKKIRESNPCRTILMTCIVHLFCRIINGRILLSGMPH